jgi:hypothetical protein
LDKERSFFEEKTARDGARGERRHQVREGRWSWRLTVMRPLSGVRRDGPPSGLELVEGAS